MTLTTSIVNEAVVLNSELFKNAWYASPSAMLLSSVEGIVLDANNAFCTLYACARTRYVGKPLLELFPQSVQQTQQDDYAALFQMSPTQHEVVSTFDFHEKTLEAGSRRISTSSRAENDVIVTSFRDLTEQIGRVRYLERQNEFANALSNLSQMLLRNPATAEEQNSLLEHALELVRTTLNASRAYYWRCYEGAEKVLHVRALAMTCECGIPCEILERSRRGVPLTMFPKAMQRSFELRQPFGGLIEEEFAELPELRDFYLGQTPPLTSLQMVPLHIDEVNWGFIAVDQVIDPRRWSEQEIAFLKTASEIIGGTLQRWSIHNDLECLVEERTQALQQANRQLSEEIAQRRHTEQDLQRRLHVEDTMWDIAQQLLQPDTSFATWRSVLQKIGSLVGAQRMMLVPLLGDRIDPESQVIQWYDATPNPKTISPANNWATDSPWLWQQVMKGEIVYLPHLDLMPTEAEVDRQSVIEGDVRHSLALIPMSGDRKQNTNVLVFIDFEERVDLYADAHHETLRIMRFAASILENKLRLDSIYNALEDRVAQRTKELITVLDFAMLTTTTGTLSEMLVPALELIADIGHCDAICIHLYDEDQDELVLSAQQGLSDAHQRRLHSMAGTGVRQRRFGEPNVVLSALSSSSDLPEALQLPGYRRYLGCELQTHGQHVGLLSAFRQCDDEFSVTAVSLISVLAEQLGLVIENHRMRIQVRDAAIEQERHRLRQELHDSITQSLYGLTLFARVGRHALEDQDEGQLRNSLMHLETGANAIHKEMRLLLFQLQPLGMQNLSLAEAIEARFDTLERKLGIQAQMESDGDADLPEELAFEIYRIAMEALNNSLKHAGAHRVSASLSETDTEYVVTLVDDGKGFDINNSKTGMGLKHMRERADSIDATLSIKAEPGKGTTVLLQIPKIFPRIQRTIDIG